MELQIKKSFIPKGRLNRPGLKMTPKYITIHETNNTEKFCDADFFANMLEETNSESSWHFTVDDHQIIQHLPLNENAWHCSDGEEGSGNRESIGIEICTYEGQDREKTLEAAVKLCQKLQREFNIPIENSKQHYDWDLWTDCPFFLRKDGNWTKFIDSISKK